MRNRFRRLRTRSMAVRPGSGRFTLSPRGMRIAGWLAALGAIALIALAVRILGGNADGTAIVPSPSATPGGPAPIAFGTALDPTSSQVSETARTERFVAGDTFAYSVAPTAGRPDVVYVEVERTGETEPEIVQAAAEGEQAVPADRPAVAFTVPAANLLEAFGPGTYVMRIRAEPDGAPIAEGTFELLADAPASSG